MKEMDKSIKEGLSLHLLVSLSTQVPVCLSVSPWPVLPPAPWCGSPWGRVESAESLCALWLPWSAAEGPTSLSPAGPSPWLIPSLHPRSPSTHRDPDGLIHKSSITCRSNDPNFKSVSVIIFFLEKWLYFPEMKKKMLKQYHCLTDRHADLLKIALNVDHITYVYVL